MKDKQYVVVALYEYGDTLFHEELVTVTASSRDAFRMIDAHPYLDNIERELIGEWHEESFDRFLCEEEGKAYTECHYLTCEQDLDHPVSVVFHIFET